MLKEYIINEFGINPKVADICFDAEKKVEKYFLEPEPAPPEASPSKLYKKNDQNDGYLSRNVFNAVRRIVATVTLWIPRSSAISACFFCSK